MQSLDSIGMRTTVNFDEDDEDDEDIGKAAARLRKESRIGVSEAVNHLTCRGLPAPAERRPFVQQTHPLGLRIEVTHVADAIDVLEGPQAR